MVLLTLWKCLINNYEFKLIYFVHLQEANNLYLIWFEFKLQHWFGGFLEMLVASRTQTWQPCGPLSLWRLKWRLSEYQSDSHSLYSIGFDFDNRHRSLISACCGQFRANMDIFFIMQVIYYTLHFFRVNNIIIIRNTSWLNSGALIVFYMRTQSQW